MNANTIKAKPYPVNLSVPYPGSMNRWKTLFRIILIIPALLLMYSITGFVYTIFFHFYSHTGFHFPFYAISGGTLIMPPLLAIVFRKRYPRWWYEWNLAFLQFSMRIGAYGYFLTENYPSMDEQQEVHLSIEYPQPADLHRGLPLVKWFLAIPHYFCLTLLTIVFVVFWFLSWVIAVIIGRVPRLFFNFIVGYLRWGLRVNAYCFLMLTDRYPPFFSNFHADENSSS